MSNEKESFFFIQTEKFCKQRKLEKMELKDKDFSEEENQILVEYACHFQKYGIYQTNHYSVIQIELIGNEKLAFFFLRQYLKWISSKIQWKKDMKVRIKEENSSNPMIEKQFKVYLNGRKLANIEQRYITQKQIKSKLYFSSQEKQKWQIYLEMKKKYPLQTTGITIYIGEWNKIMEMKEKVK